MATFAFFPSPITGAINPFLGLGHDLTALGHRVVFYLPEGYRDTVGAVGAELRTYRLERARPHRPGDDAVTRFAHTPMWLTAECRQVLPQIEPDVRALAPDVIVYHMLCVWGRLLARLMPAAAAMVVGSYVGNEHFSPVRTAHYQAMAGKLADAFGDYSADVAALGRRYGLRLQPRELFAREERLVLVQMPREFHPAGDTFGDRYHFMGASLRPPGCDPTDGLPALEPGHPVVYVSFGTLVSFRTDLMSACVEAFADGDWQVVLSVDDQSAPATVPANVHVMRRVPQLKLLPRVSAFVTHGGTNSVVEALAFGVPMVVVPEAPEHAITADRVAELELGVRLRTDEVTAGELRAAVERVARSVGMRDALAKMRGAVHAAGGSAAAAAALARLADADRAVRSGVG